jgi:hypothetical protein
MLPGVQGQPEHQTGASSLRRLGIDAIVFLSTPCRPDIDRGRRRDGEGLIRKKVIARSFRRRRQTMRRAHAVSP